MKAQWRLIDIDTGRVVVSIKDEIELVDFFKDCYKGETISWDEAVFLFGDPQFANIPLGILRSRTTEVGEIKNE